MILLKWTRLTRTGILKIRLKLLNAYLAFSQDNYIMPIAADVYYALEAPKFDCYFNITYALLFQQNIILLHLYLLVRRNKWKGT